MIAAIRHARVHNPDHVVYARLSGFHLSPQGRAEARTLAARLAHMPVVAVYASPLERAVETARILAEPHGIDLAADDRLLEWSFWVRWQGIPWGRIREHEPELLEAYARNPTGASPEDPLEGTAGRILRWAEEAEERHDAAGPDKVVLGVTHEAPLIAAMLVGQGSGLGGFHSVDLPHLASVRLRPEPVGPVDLVGSVVGEGAGG